MDRRLKLLLIRPNYESFEEYLSFRQKCSIKFKANKYYVIKDELVNEWKEFWARIYPESTKQVYNNIFIN